MSPASKPSTRPPNRSSASAKPPSPVIAKPARLPSRLHRKPSQNSPVWKSASAVRRPPLRASTVCTPISAAASSSSSSNSPPPPPNNSSASKKTHHSPSSSSSSPNSA